MWSHTQNGMFCGQQEEEFLLNCGSDAQLYVLLYRCSKFKQSLPKELLVISLWLDRRSQIAFKHQRSLEANLRLRFQVNQRLLFSMFVISLTRCAKLLNLTKLKYIIAYFFCLQTLTANLHKSNTGADTIPTDNPMITVNPHSKTPVCTYRSWLACRAQEKRQWLRHIFHQCFLWVLTER